MMAVLQRLCNPAGSGAVQQRQLHEEDEKGKRNTPNKSLVFG